MSYVSSNLFDDEAVIYRARISLWPYFPAIILGLVLLPAYGAGLLVFVWLALKWWTTEVVFTDHRIMYKTGIIAHHSLDLDLSRVESIQVRQGVIQRLLCYGSIVVSGAGNPLEVLPKIVDPMTFKQVLTRYRQAERVARGA